MIAFLLTKLALTLLNKPMGKGHHRPSCHCERMWSVQGTTAVLLTRMLYHFATSGPTQHHRFHHSLAHNTTSSFQLNTGMAHGNATSSDYIRPAQFTRSLALSTNTIHLQSLLPGWQELRYIFLRSPSFNRVSEYNVQRPV